MRYSILIYSAIGAYAQLPENEQQAYMKQHRDLQADLAARGDFVTAQLMPTTAAVTLKPADRGDKPLIVDGPYCETKEQFMGFYVIDSDSLEEAIEWAARISSPFTFLEVRPVAWSGGVLGPDTPE